MFSRNIFVGVGDFGNRVTLELSIIKRELREEIYCENHEEHMDYLSIHSFPSTDTKHMAYLKENDHFIILAGSTLDPNWEEARKTLYESGPCFMLTIGIDVQREINTGAFQPFANECLVFPDPSLFDPVKIAQFVMQIIFIHEPWQSNLCTRGSLIGYDLGDTKELFAGKVTKSRKMVSDKESYRQDFSKFLIENKADLSRAQGILISFWDWDDVLSIPKVCELYEETKRLAMPEADVAFTCHILPGGETAFMVTLFLTATQSV
ncbi:MAG: hypothetical protein WCJ37_09405 [Syntrophus sp. (in: bacteria)]